MLEIQLMKAFVLEAGRELQTRILLPDLETS